jgi:hypothetical protein
MSDVLGRATPLCDLPSEIARFILGILLNFPLFNPDLSTIPLKMLKFISGSFIRNFEYHTTGYNEVVYYTTNDTPIVRIYFFEKIIYIINYEKNIVAYYDF